MFDIIYEDLRNFERFFYERDEIMDNEISTAFLFAMKTKRDLMLQFAMDKEITPEQFHLLEEYLYEICYDFLTFIERGGRIEHNRQIPRHN